MSVKAAKVTSTTATARECRSGINTVLPKPDFTSARVFVRVRPRASLRDAAEPAGVHAACSANFVSLGLCVSVVCFLRAQRTLRLLLLPLLQVQTPERRDH